MDASPYLARLSDAALEQRADLADRISMQEGRFVSQVVVDPWLVESASPTLERAAQFQGVYEQLIVDAIAWLRPPVAYEA